MKCPACGNIKEFTHFYLSWMTRHVEYNEDGDAVDADSGEMDIDSTKEIECKECNFNSLPEVFGFSEEWRGVERNEDGEFVLTEPEEVGYYTVAVRGSVYLPRPVGETYFRLYNIHQATSPAELVEVLVDEHPAVRNSAIEKMDELVKGGMTNGSAL